MQELIIEEVCEESLDGGCGIAGCGGVCATL